MDQDKSRRENEIAKQCVSLGAGISLVSFFLLYFRPTWPGAFGVLALSGMGVWMTYLLKKPS